MADEEFRHPRLAAVYDALDPDRGDLDAYVALAEELGARRVLDVGCGTGTFALVLAGRGLDVVGVDPAPASLAVARAKPGAHLVRWVDGDATTPYLDDRDLVTMTGNTAQAIVDPQQWRTTLTAVRAALRPGGHLVLETRDPAARGWERWTKDLTYRTVDIPGAGAVTSWLELTAVDLPLVGFRWTWVFAEDGATLTSSSTLRFRDRHEVLADLRAAGFDEVEVRDAPDRPGLELVVLARRPAGATADPVVTPDAAEHARAVDLLGAERRLQAAQRDADVEALDALLHPRVVGAGPDGAVFGKDDDLDAYRSGALRITRLVEESVDVREDGETGLTTTVAAVEAVQAGAAVSARLRYTRLWVRDAGSWRVLAATFVPV